MTQARNKARTNLLEACTFFGGASACLTEIGEEVGDIVPQGVEIAFLLEQIFGGIQDFGRRVPRRIGCRLHDADTAGDIRRAQSSLLDAPGDFAGGRALFSDAAPDAAQAYLLSQD